MKLQKVTVSVGETIPTGRFSSKKFFISLEASLNESDSGDTVINALWKKAGSEIAKQKKNLFDTAFSAKKS